MKQKIILYSLTLLSIFLFNDKVEASPQYNFGFEAYNITDTCDLSNEAGQWECENKFIENNLENYKITNNKVSAGANILVVLTETTINSELEGLELSFQPDLNKITPYDYLFENFDTVGTNKGIYTPVRIGTKYTSQWTPITIYKDDIYSYITLDKNRRNK